ncbi:hypothetical protein FKP32DRAFT_1100973 [Trametes sanguinea]|nr:hypothetical protein FKP32DRAFT_1100973 [Trametes sanguinea]
MYPSYVSIASISRPPPLPPACFRRMHPFLHPPLHTRPPMHRKRGRHSPPLALPLQSRSRGRLLLGVLPRPPRDTQDAAGQPRFVCKTHDEHSSNG